MKRLALAIAALAFLGGCADMADSVSKVAGLGVVTRERSTFDNATVIAMSPAHLYAEGSWGNAVRLGARWSSASPDSVALILAYESNVASGTAYIGLKSLQINIDGEISSFAVGAPTDLSSSSYNTVSKTIYTSSKNAVVIPYPLLKRMVAAKDTRLRIHTSKGYEDSQFSIERIPGGQGTAILSMKEFTESVDSVRSKKGA
ncbi:hypothetical protein [Variovorax sp. dw_308]|uniref:hypothetical protein n=1 Tax=Variovorax sp. dw_308 TaxID=2721546 RepID=UPI001C4495FE|nr:hypothetical protein [Variovorax sp. dw_308]